MKTVPERITVAYSMSAPCAHPDQAFLLRNDGASTLRLEDISVSPSNFTVRAETLPTDLAPEETLYVSLGFQSEVAGEVTGDLSISGPDGCAELPIRGFATEDAVTRLSPLAMDFGRAPPGHTSDPQELTFTSVGPEAPANMYESFETSPVGIFEVLSAPDVPAELGSCAELAVQVAFHAPDVQGRETGSLVSVVTSNGFEAVIDVPLFGTAAPISD